TLTNIGTALLTDNSAAGGNTFTIDHTWTGAATLTGPAAGAGVTLDTVTVTKAGGFDLTSTSLTDTADGMDLTLANIGKALLTDNSASGGNTFTIDHTWTGTATLTGPAAGAGVTLDTVSVTKAGGFDLTSTSLTDTADGMDLTLTNIGKALLTDNSAAGGHTFTIDHTWTGAATLTGPAAGAGVTLDTVSVTKAGGFDLTSTSLTDTADGMDLTLTNIGKALLTDNSAAGGHTFTIDHTWTGAATLTGPAAGAGVTLDTVSVTKAGGFDLTSTSLTDTADGMDLTLANIGKALLTDNSAAGGNTFTIDHTWTGLATLAGPAVGAGVTLDTVSVIKGGGFDLTSTSLTDSADGMDLTLTNIGTALLTDGSAAGGHTFTIDHTWTGAATLAGPAAGAGVTLDTVSVTKAGGFDLTSTSLTDTADG